MYTLLASRPVPLCSATNFLMIPGASKMQNDLVKVPLPLRPWNYLATPGLGVRLIHRLRVRPKPVQGTVGEEEGQSCFHGCQQLLVTELQGQNTGERKDPSDSRNTQGLPKVTEQFTAEQSESPCLSATVRCLSRMARISKPFLVAELFFFSLFLS